MHDWKVDRTTNGTGYTTDLTLAEIQQLDAAYNFIPGRNAVAGQPESEYPFRGVRTGAKPPPEGYTAEDFRVPTLTEVLEAFPNTPINIEIKGQEDQESEFVRNAELLAQLLNGTDRRDLIVVSFNQAAVNRFHELAPDDRHRARPERAGGLLPERQADAERRRGGGDPGADAVRRPRGADARARPPGAPGPAGPCTSGCPATRRTRGSTTTSSTTASTGSCPRSRRRWRRCCASATSSGRAARAPTRAAWARGERTLTEDGDARILLRRRGLEPVAYRGSVQLRTRKGKLLGSAPFRMKKGKDKARATVELRCRRAACRRRGAHEGRARRARTQAAQAAGLKLIGSSCRPCTPSGVS